MALDVAVQMDPIERINIRGDSTFALLLEAQARGHSLSYYTPDRLAQVQGRIFASVQPLSVRDTLGDHFALGESRRIELTELDVILLRQDPPFDLAYITTTHMLERVHPPDDLRSNMVRGGSPKATDLTARERHICERLGPHLRERGLLLVGIDVIGDYLTEINVTSPTGIRAVRNVGGPDIAKLVWEKIEAKRKNDQSS